MRLWEFSTFWGSPASLSMSQWQQSLLLWQSRLVQFFNCCGMINGLINYDNSLFEVPNKRRRATINRFMWSNKQSGCNCENKRETLIWSLAGEFSQMSSSNIRQCWSKTKSIFFSFKMIFFSSSGLSSPLFSFCISFFCFPHSLTHTSSLSIY